MKRFISAIFTMTKSQRNGAVVLLLLVLALMVFRFFIPRLFKPDYSRYSEEYMELIAQMEQEIDSIEKGLDFSDYEEKEITVTDDKVKREPKSIRKNVEKPMVSKPKPEMFDPNNANYTDLVSMGFSSKVANTIINYREKGGRFYQPSDLMKIYGLDSAFYKVIFPFIVIANTNEKKVVHRLEMNAADTTDWMEINGIGSVFARRICSYRKLLGGYVSVQQLLEVYNFPAETFERIKGSLYVDTGLVRKIDLNFSSAYELALHPYCNKEMARRIVAYRSKNGSFSGTGVLLADSVITPETYVKIKPYLKPD
ncbi:MAG: helix-hairpin-helix domain-containing protein [Prolixibacteraceae bacterium]|nr:helix-hairpin-helix domain-containing protein [Prolixibacteraceae bacterium]